MKKVSSFCDFMVFTLLELLVVISIIAILASLLLPALNNAKANMHKINCLSRMKQVGIGFEMYINDSNDFYVPFSWGPTVSDTTMNWAYCLKKNNYVPDPGVYKCPAATMMTSIYTAGPNDVLTLPDSPYTYLYITIGYNYCRGFGRIDYVGDGRYIPVKRVQVKNPSKKFLIGDSHRGLNNFDLGINGIASADPAIQNGTLHDRHRGAANILFADGHGESIKNAELTSIQGNNIYVYWRYHTIATWNY